MLHSKERRCHRPETHDNVTCLMQGIPHGGKSQAEAAMFVRYWWQVGRSPTAPISCSPALQA